MTSKLKTISKNVNKQILLNEKNITIDAKHNEMINHFINLQESVPLLKDELKKLISEYNNKDITRKNDLDYIVYRDNLRDKINNLKSKINNIINNEDINNYYLNVGTLLHSYYENIENSKNDEQNNNLNDFENNFLYNDEDDIIEKKDNYNSVIHFFNNRTLEKNHNNNENVLTTLKMSDFIKHEEKFKKKNILDEYLQKIDPNHISKIKIDLSICKCPQCDIEMILYPSDGIQICGTCGFQQNVLIESDKPSFKDPPLEICYFSYKRINHFNECLRQKIFKRIGNIYKFLINYILF
jgi:hypothetical protein